MGAKDTKSKEYLSDNSRFADACNFVLYEGQKVIRAEDLTEQDSTEVLSILGMNEKEIQQQKWRDLLKRAVIKTSNNTIYVLLGIENQSDIHYAMPVKNMIYDALNYGSQVKEATKLHKDNYDKQKPAEFLSGFKKTDELTPVVTITIYWGPEKWDAPLSLHQMFRNVDKGILKFVPDYHINLIEPYAIEDFGRFESELGEVLEAIKCSNDKEDFKELIKNNIVFKGLSNESLAAINLFTGSEIPLTGKEEVTDVCKAIEDLKQEYFDEHKDEYAKELDVKKVITMFENGGTLELAIATFQSLEEDRIRGLYQEYQANL